ncbi:DUF6083 domain-containing protein [Streptomyces phaeolivaceus]|nr:DUF6083 domain-containing protein [Streptomyces phaeolivaceus]
MRIWHSSQSKTPVKNCVEHCTWCGNSVEWHDTFEGTRVPIIPREFPIRTVPPRYRWHLSNGTAYLGANPRDYGYCRVKHSSVCPAVEHNDLDPAMQPFVRALAIRMQKAIAEGSFVPAPVGPRGEAEVQEPDPATAEERGGTRHVIKYSGFLRICPGPLDELACVAATAEGRCEGLVLDEGEGYWEQIEAPHLPGRAGQMTLLDLRGRAWVWSIDIIDFQHALRWLRQRCHDHGKYGSYPDASPMELVTFDPYRHGDFLISERPAGYRASPVPGWELSPGTAKRQCCATEDCHNSTVVAVEKSWLCWQCERRAKRRRAVHAKWQARASEAQALSTEEESAVGDQDITGGSIPF